MAINLNTADVSELEQVPGLGHKRAQDLVNYRDENGDFLDWEDVKDVPGFSDELVETLKKGGVNLGEEEGDEDTDENDW